MRAIANIDPSGPEVTGTNGVAVPTTWLHTDDVDESGSKVVELECVVGPGSGRTMKLGAGRFDLNLATCGGSPDSDAKRGLAAVRLIIGDDGSTRVESTGPFPVVVKPAPGIGKASPGTYLEAADSVFYLHPLPDAPAQLTPSGTARWFDRIRERVGDLVDQRVGGVPSWVVLVELFIGFGWVRAVTEKAIDPQWWNGAVIDSFVAQHAQQTVPWYQPFLAQMLAVSVVGLGVVVMLLQLVAGASLVLGRFRTLGLAVGMFLNLNFVLAGAVNPSIFYLICQGAVAFWLLEHRMPPDRGQRALSHIRTAGVASALLGAPFISTVHPADVIDDPAMILVFFGLLCATAAQPALTRVRGSGSCTDHSS